MPANTIAKGESMAKSFPKINQAIQDAFDALSKSNNADLNSNSALVKAKSVQNQLNTLVIESGTSDAETLQARTDLFGNVYDTVKERMDAEQEFSMALETKLNEEQSKTDAFIQGVPYEKVGTSGLRAKSSVFIKNDDNFFGRTSSGKDVNIATIQQNDITDFGNFDTDTWVRGKDKVSIRAPKIDITPEMDANGVATGPGREILHTGITAFHAKLHSTGTQLLTRGNNNALTITTDLQSCFPVNSVSGSKYTIPKAGMYLFMVTLRPTVVTQQISMIQFGLEITKGADVSYTDLGAEIASNAYQTAFIGKTFMFQLSQGDIVVPFVKPFNEDMTIGAGTRFFCYYMGAMPTL